MIRKITLLSMMFFVSISSGFEVSRSFAEARLTDFEEVDTYINTKMKELGIPGAALVTPQTPFFTGSTGKSFTALAIMQPVEAGKSESSLFLS